MKKIFFFLLCFLTTCVTLRLRSYAETTYNVRIFVEKIVPGESFSSRLHENYITYTETVSSGYRYARSEILAKGYEYDENCNVKSIIARWTGSQSNNFVEITDEMGGYTILEDTDIYIRSEAIDDELNNVRFFVKKIVLDEDYDQQKILDESLITYNVLVTNNYLFTKEEILNLAYDFDDEYNVESIYLGYNNVNSEGESYFDSIMLREEILPEYYIYQNTDIYIIARHIAPFNVKICSEYADIDENYYEVYDKEVVESFIGSYTYANQEIREKSKVDNMEGYIVDKILVKDDSFSGGYLDITNEPSYTIEKDTIISVRYRKERYDLNIITNLESVNIDKYENQKIYTKIELDFPKIENYKLYGLYKDSEYECEVDFENGYYLDGTTTLYAKYIQYKNKSLNFIKSDKGILSLSQITNIYRSILCDGVVCENWYDNYVGNGSRIGKYQIYFYLSIGNKIFNDCIEVLVYNGLMCNYIYDNIVVIDNSISYSKEYLVSDLQLIDVLPKSEIYVDIDGEYYDKTSNNPIQNPKIDEYDVVVQYRTTDNEGVKEIILKVVSGVQSDLLIEAPYVPSTIEYILIGLIFIVIVMIIIKMLKRLF